VYRRILVPLDGSNASNLGRVQAIGLAQTEGARLRFLNVLDESLGLSNPNFMIIDISNLLKSVRKLAEQTLEKAAALARKKGVHAETSLVPSRGRSASEVILDETRQWHADLIVMGTHGRRGFNRLLLGSDAERVLRDTPVPLLLVREGYKTPRRRRPVKAGGT